MSGASRLAVCFIAGAFAAAQSGCNMVPGTWLRQSQLTNRQLYGQTQATSQTLGAIASEKDQLAQQNAELRQRLDLANQRLENLDSERSQLHARYTSLMDKARSQDNPLPPSATQKFKDLASRYPGFNFDPETGVSKFQSDILFESGSSRIKSSAQPLLQEFAKIMSEGDANRLNILVTGHTDDKRIAKPATAKEHPTNWHLSTNRANEVLVSLEKFGVKGNRMGSSGYGPYQPVAPNTNDTNRAKNRRVEIFVLAPEASIAGWDPSEREPVSRD